MRPLPTLAALLLVTVALAPVAIGSHQMAFAVSGDDTFTQDGTAGHDQVAIANYDLHLDAAMMVRLCSFDGNGNVGHHAAWTLGSLSATTTDTTCSTDGGTAWSLPAGDHAIQIHWSIDGAHVGTHSLSALVRTLGDDGNTVGHTGERATIAFTIARPDADGDGVTDADDVCPGHNDGADFDQDGRPDGCDPDDDNDGVPDTNDQFPRNPERASGNDLDGDGLDDEFDADDDGDGVADTGDRCPRHADASNADFDNDGLGDVCDSDDDNDGVPDTDDGFSRNANRASGNDLDGDGVDDEFDGDDDGDGHADGTDHCPRHADAANTDTDNDGLGDACDADDDNDGVPDEQDAFPLDPDRHTVEGDGDSIPDDQDNCPNHANPDQADLDGDGAGDVCDADDDGDGVDDADDAFPRNANRASGNDLDGDGIDDEFDDNDDGDAHPDASDNCPRTNADSQADPDQDGLGNPCDPDDDNDGVPDEQDRFPFNKNRASGNDLDLDGIDDEFDLDMDADGIPDDTDVCPARNNPSQTDTDADGLGDACDLDDDGDGVLDDDDAFPKDASRFEADPLPEPVAVEPLATNIVERMQADIGITLEADERIELIDRDGDGRFDGLQSSAGSVSVENAAVDAQILMVRQGETLAVVDPESGDVHPVQQLVGTVSEFVVPETQESEEGPAQLTVSVPAKTGWIKVSVPDLFPERPVTSFVRSDGLVIPVDQVWRSGGELHFMDDPEVAYTVGFSEPSETVAMDDSDAPVGGTPTWVWGVLAAMLAVLGGVTVVLVRRLRD